jgi:hypothetical protein
MSAPGNARSLLDRANPGKVLTILPQGRFGSKDAYKVIEAGERNVPAETVALIDNTTLGAVTTDERPDAPRLQNVAEAVLYLGPSDKLTRIGPSAFIFRDEDYWSELNRRWRAIYGEPFNLKKAGLDLRGRLSEVILPIGNIPDTRQMPRPAAPRDVGPPPTGLTLTNAIEFVLNTLNRYPMIALGDVHMSLEFHRFVQKLLRDPRLPGRVNDIVVEFGNPLYQAVIDRYVVNGERVSFDQRKPAWQFAAIGWFVANSPVYEQFFEAVRETNLSLPVAKRMRVILGDVALDIAQFRANPESYLPQFASGRGSGPDPRDVALAASVNKVVAQGRRGIMICGSGHLKFDAGRPNARSLIEKANPGKFYLIDQVGPSHPSWPPESIVVSAGDYDPNHARLWLGSPAMAVDGQTGVRPSPLIYRDRDYWATINLFQEMLGRRSPIDLADPVFEYRGKYFETPAPSR